MPTYSPGRPGSRPKRCTTATERRAFVAANIRKRCAAGGCSKTRTWTSSHCANHRGRVANYGHPEGGNLDTGLVETYRVKFSKWLDLYENTNQCRAALEVMDALLAGKLIKRRSLALREFRRLREGARHPGDPGTGPITAREALEVVGAIYWISLYRPDVLKDDVRLTYALATYLFKMKLMDARHRVSRATGRTYQYHPRPAATGKQDVGGVIRRDLAVFFVNAWNRAEDDFRADAHRAMTLKEPMASVTGAPAPTPAEVPAPAQPAPAPATAPQHAPTLGHADPTPGSAGPTAGPSTADLIARSEAVLRKTAPQASLRPYDPSGPSRQAPYDPSRQASLTPRGPTAPTPAPDQPVSQPAQPVSTPLPPSATVLSHAPKTTATAHDSGFGSFGEPTGESFERFAR